MLQLTSPKRSDWSSWALPRDLQSSLEELGIHDPNSLGLLAALALDPHGVVVHLGAQPEPNEPEISWAAGELGKLRGAYSRVGGRPIADRSLGIGPRLVTGGVTPSRDYHRPKRFLPQLNDHASRLVARIQL